MKKQIIIKKLHPPLVKCYIYTFPYLEVFAKKNKGLRPIQALQFLHTYSNERNLGLSAKSNLLKMVKHVIKLSLLQSRQMEYESYFYDAIKLFKVRRIEKTVMPCDVPKPNDLDIAKEYLEIKAHLLMDFINTTCLRITETVNVKMSDCSYSTISQGYSIKFTRKGGYERDTWIPKELFDRIVIEYASSTYLFQSPYDKNKHLHTCTAQRWLRKASKFTPRPIRPHLIRHKGINEVVKENAHIPLYVLCDLFGHTERTLKKYYLNPPELNIPEINKRHYLNLKQSKKETNNDEPTVHENSN